jgi:hypothetical protein
MDDQADSWSFRYVEIDIPAGLTIPEWRARRAAAALTLRHARRRRRALRRLWRRFTGRPERSGLLGPRLKSVRRELTA